MSDRVKKLVTPQGFLDAYYQERSANNTSTNEEIFNQLNDEYKAIFGKHRYASYESFRIVKNRKLKR